MSGLPFFSVLSEVFGSRIQDYIELFTTKPRELLNMQVPKIEEGQNACLTLFTDDAWTLDSQTNKSKSVASPFYGKQLKGKVLGIVNNGQLILN